MRCDWLNTKNPLYVQYHDEEWGVPVHDDKLLFEMLILEGAQAGLSFETILNKRGHYREVYDGFDPQKVARYDDAKVTALMNDSGIVRNRLKIMSSIENAKVFLEIQKVYGSFDRYLWAFVDFNTVVSAYKTYKELPTETEISKAISKDLKKRGMKFVGPTIIYAYMQAVGLVNDHIVGCPFKNKSGGHINEI